MKAAGARRRGQAPRIVFVNRFYAPDHSATSQMLTGIAEGLAAHGFQVDVVCSRQSYEDPRAGFAHLELRSGVTVRRVDTTRFGRAGLLGRGFDYVSFYLAAAFALLRIVRRGDVIVAKTDPPLLSILGAVVARVTGARLVNWLQDLFPEVATRLELSPLPGWAERMLVNLRDRSLRAAAMNVVLGERMRAFVAHRGVVTERITVICNWADGDAIRPIDSSTSRLRREAGLERRFVVAYSGNLGRAHEFQTLLGAAKRLAGDPQYAFLMVGGGANMLRLERDVRDAGLVSFRFLPYQPLDQLRDSLAAGDVHLVSLLPALEGLIVPSKLYGILAGGRPVIFVGDTDGEVACVIRDEACGLTARPTDAESLEAAIRELCADAVMRETMGVRARAAFERRYSRAASIAAWSAMLESILGAPQSPRDCSAAASSADSREASSRRSA